MRFGRRSERINHDQPAIALEEVDSDIGRIRESHSAIVTDKSDAPSRRKPLPDHLPREDVLLDKMSCSMSRIGFCACCGGALHAIGESVSIVGYDADIILRSER